MAKANKVVPESKQALDQLKYEIAAELGLPVGKSMANANVEFATELGAIPSGSVKEDYWGHIASRDAGAVGGAITSRLIRKAEEMMLNL
ncbi:alpha/beta-type small acid-soluble spore protein [Paenibacillus doosanensis]|uniref:Small, acid-soluble spore protein C2 n=1 Tax=Paenibacillus konkukensis TaxID=2020716 RepID=A0ABY4RQL5_9BACL|nr:MULTISPECIES: alpha/beta-type small acid-soluble spore protein [Paenibacillus]MCS7459965.1 alpha/beta-type small acid-soluble spore protein [Paenibacillus doosanensis]UQZ84408.1 Small, acid-soluble spore protein C2 [Paenibacillus konkukensis]